MIPSAAEANMLTVTAVYKNKLSGKNITLKISFVFEKKNCSHASYLQIPHLQDTKLPQASVETKYKTIFFFFAESCPFTPSPTQLSLSNKSTLHSPPTRAAGRAVHTARGRLCGRGSARVVPVVDLLQLRVPGLLLAGRGCVHLVVGGLLHHHRSACGEECQAKEATISQAIRR